VAELAPRDGPGVRLTQWGRGGEAVGDRMVTTWVGQGERECLHPSAQVGQCTVVFRST
jgi:hypothetical protein